MRTNTKVSTLVLAAFLATGSAHAIELLRPTLLPDAGFGSYAAASFRIEATGYFMAVGEKTNSTGRDLPMAWTVDGSGHVVASVQLAVPTGFEGEALDGAEFPNGDVVVVGNIEDALGHSRAVLWRRPSLGAFGAPVQLFPNAQESRMARADYCGDGQTHIVAACSVETADHWAPLAIYVSSNGAWFLKNLPPGVGAEGQALAADGSDHIGEPSTVCGFNLVLENIPFWWSGNAPGFTSHTLPHWDGFTSSPLDVRNDTSSVLVCGEADNGSGAVRAFRTNGSSLTRLYPVTGFANASADSFWLGSNDALGAAVVAGTSSNQSGPTVATAWILDQGDPINFKNLLANPSSLGEVHRWRADGSCVTTVGEAESPGALKGQAALFMTTDTHVPDAMKIVTGTPYGPVHVANLWHNDGLSNRVSTKLVNNVMTLTVDFTFTPMNKRAWTSGTFHLVGRTLGTGVTGTLKIYQRNESTLGFYLMKTVHVGNTAQSIVGTLPTPMSTYYNATTGAMHMRLVYTGDTTNAQSFVIEWLEDLNT